MLEQRLESVTELTSAEAGFTEGARPAWAGTSEEGIRAMKFTPEYRLATQAEIASLQRKDCDGMPHVAYGCTQCGNGFWTAKNITLCDDGSYLGVRNIFYNGDSPECPCPSSALRCIVRVKAKAD